MVAVCIFFFLAFVASAASGQEFGDMGVTLTSALPSGDVYSPGSPVTVLCGMANNGDETVVVKEIRGLLSSPDDFSITIKNLDVASLAGEVLPGSEITFPYTFHFAKARNMRLRLTLELVYEQLGVESVVAFHNDTVQWEDSSMLDSAGGIFSILMTLVLMCALSFASFNMYKGSQANSKK